MKRSGITEGEVYAYSNFRDGSWARPVMILDKTPLRWHSHPMGGKGSGLFRTDRTNPAESYLVGYSLVDARGEVDAWARADHASWETGADPVPRPPAIVEAEALIEPWRQFVATMPLVRYGSWDESAIKAAPSELKFKPYTAPTGGGGLYAFLADTRRLHGQYVRWRAAQDRATAHQRDQQVEADQRAVESATTRMYLIRRMAALGIRPAAHLPEAVPGDLAGGVIVSTTVLAELITLAEKAGA